MCVIIHKPAGTSFPIEKAITAAKRNSDGFGIMYFDPEKKKVLSSKTISYPEKKIRRVFGKLEKFDVCFHYRLRTHGTTLQENCHPFQILDQQTDGEDMFFMHNGVLNKLDMLKDESDTQAFNRLILQPVLKKDPSMVETESFRLLIESFIGSSKLCFMRGDGTVIKFNEKLGSDLDHCWVSNTHSFNEPIQRTPYKANTAWKNSYNTYQGSTYQGYDANWWKKEEPEKKKDLALNPKDFSMGDKVCVLHSIDENFLEEGSVSAFYENAIGFRFKGLQGVEMSMSFQKENGESYGAGNNKYYILTDKKIKQKAKEEEQKPLLSVIPKEKEEVKETLSYKGVTVDPDNRCGFDNDTDSFNIYGEGEDTFTTWDIYSMTPQKRFEFFVDQTEIAFNMFQDLVEDNVCYEDYLEDNEDSLNTKQRSIGNEAD